MIEERRKKQVEALEVLQPITQKLKIKYAISENTLSEEAKNELNKIREIEKTVDRENLYYKVNKYTFNFHNFWKNNNCNITTEETDEDQRDLIVKILNFKKKIKTEKSREKTANRRYS